MAEGELPPELQELEERRAEGEAHAGRGKPSLDELLDKVRSLPGGEERLEKAKRRGPRGAMPDESEFFLSELAPSQVKALSWLNLFKVAEAYAQTAFSVWVDKSNNWYSSNPLASLRGFGSISGAQYNTANALYLQVTNWGVGRLQVSNPTAYLVVRIPSDGWYIVNFEAYASNNLTLEHCYSGNPWQNVDTAWGGYTLGTQDYPVLLHLGTGDHYFGLKGTSGCSFVYGAGAYSL